MSSTIEWPVGLIKCPECDKLQDINLGREMDFNETWESWILPNQTCIKCGHEFEEDDEIEY